MSGFLIFEIKRDKMDKILNFLKDRFSIMNGPMDMIFGMFSETYMRLLKNIILQFFSKYSKSYNTKYQEVLKIQQFLAKIPAGLRPSNYMHLIELYKSFLEWS